MTRKRNDSGQFEPEYSRDDVLEAMTPGEPYHGSEICDKLDDIPDSTVYRYLNQLADENKIMKKKQGETSAIWMRTE